MAAVATGGADGFTQDYRRDCYLQQEQTAGNLGAG